MAHGYQSDSNREAMLRRTAIVLSSLPASTASRLMNAMGDQSRSAVRRTMTTLSDVDPLERQRALQAFRVSLKQQPVATEKTASHHASVSSPQASPSGRPRSRIVTGLSETLAEPTEVSADSSANGPSASDPLVNDSPLAFLDKVDDPTLLRLLSSEHPQAIALVLASISPTHAARLVPELDDDLRRETLSRLGRLGEIPEAAAMEVANHFRDRLNHLGSTSNPRGGRILDAILAAMPQKPPAEKVSDTLNSSDPAAQLSERLRAAASRQLDPFASPVPVSQQPIPEQSEPPRTVPQRAVSPPRQVDAERSARVDEAISEETFADSAIAGSIEIETQWAQERSPFESTDAIDRHLAGLPPKQLCAALAKVSTDVAILALCGLPNRLTEAALGILPRAKARQVRAKMNALGSVQLRQIDRAKEEVAIASLSTATDSKLPVAA